MSTSRRKFLKSGTLVALAAGLPTASLERALGHELPGTSMAGLTKESFTEQLNTDFIIHHASSKTSARLVDVKTLPAATPRGEAFSLLFRGRHSTALKQNTYVIDHEKLGRFSFLLVPIRTGDQSAPYYEAVINRLHA